MELADGRNVPDAAVEALEAFERRWPGATFPTARGGIAAAVLEAMGLDLWDNEVKWPTHCRACTHEQIDHRAAYGPCQHEDCECGQWSHRAPR